MTTDKYHRLVTRSELRAADGTRINYSVNEHMLANGYADQFPGSYVVECIDEVEVTASERVLIDSGIPESEWSLIRADAHRMQNMARDAGRPSDAMRSAVAAFKAGHLTEESFRASRPSGYYPDDVV